jgi:hypothetical protein
MLEWLIALVAGVGLVGLLIVAEVVREVHRARAVLKYDVKAFIARVVYDVKTFGAGTGPFIPRGLSPIRRMIG